jgi:hypothetical protein
VYQQHVSSPVVSARNQLWQRFVVASPPIDLCAQVVHIHDETVNEQLKTRSVQQTFLSNSAPSLGVSGRYTLESLSHLFTKSNRCATGG